MLRYRDLKCQKDILKIADGTEHTFFTFNIEFNYVKCYFYDNSELLLCKLDDIISDISDPQLLNFLTEKIIIDRNVNVYDDQEKTINHIKEYNGRYIDKKSFIDIIAWINPSNYHKYCKILYFINLSFTLERIMNFNNKLRTLK